MHDDSAEVVRNMNHLMTPPERSKWWIWAIMGAAVVVLALVVATVTLAIIDLDRGAQLAQYRNEQRCRSDVNLEVNLSVVDVVDALSQMPRDQVALSVALNKMHLVKAQAQALEASGACGYSGSIPSPPASVKP